MSENGSGPRRGFRGRLLQVQNQLGFSSEARVRAASVRVSEINQRANAQYQASVTEWNNHVNRLYVFDSAEHRRRSLRYRREPYEELSFNHWLEMNPEYDRQPQPPEPITLHGYLAENSPELLLAASRMFPGLGGVQSGPSQADTLPVSEQVSGGRTDASSAESESDGDSRVSDVEGEFGELVASDERVVEAVLSRVTVSEQLSGPGADAPPSYVEHAEDEPPPPYDQAEAQRVAANRASGPSVSERPSPVALELIAQQGAPTARNENATTRQADSAAIARNAASRECNQQQGRG